LAQADWQGALIRYELALDTVPGHGPLHSGYARALLSLGSAEEATIAAQRGVDLDPLFGNAHWIRGVVQLSARDYSVAIASLERGADVLRRLRLTGSLVGGS
jgi:hypothetical protein